MTYKDLIPQQVKAVQNGVEHRDVDEPHFVDNDIGLWWWQQKKQEWNSQDQFQTILPYVDCKHDVVLPKMYE